MQQIAQLIKGLKPGNGLIAGNPEAAKAISPVTIRDIDMNHHPKVRDAVTAAYEWVERKKSHPNASLVLVASQVKRPDGTADINRTGYGVGKTHIAKSIMWSQRVVTEEGDIVGHCGQFYLARNLIDRLREEPPEILAPKPNKLYSCDTSYAIGTHVVVIDDVGTEGVLPFVSKESQELERQARYFDFINYCYGGIDLWGNRTGISVVITANMTLDQLATHLGGRCWSRLLEMAPAGFMVDMTGVPDHRRQTSGR